MTTVVAGTTSYIRLVFIQDDRLTTGGGLTGLVYNSPGLAAAYYRTDGSASVLVSLVTMTLGMWASGGFREVNASTMPGWYAVGLPNALLASGGVAVGLHLFGAAHMIHLPVLFEFQAAMPSSSGFLLT